MNSPGNWESSDGVSTRPHYRKPKAVSGHELLFRCASVDDAEFITRLRTDAGKAKYLSHTSPDVAAQRQWLLNNEADESQVYFLIQGRVTGVRHGTVRLYDARGLSFCWGSWIKADGSPKSFAVESALMVYHFARSLGFLEAHFEVRKGNEPVWRFHERFGAIRLFESECNYHYRISSEAIEGACNRFSRFLPNGIAVQY